MSEKRDQSRRIAQLLDPDGMARVLDQIADSIFSSHPNPDTLLLMGMASRGIPLAERIGEHLEKLYGRKVPMGNLDATFYRDDFHFRKRLMNPSMKITAMPRPVEGMDVILVDDVLFTGRSIRAAMESIMDMGRPNTIRLAVMVDRGRRELPIAPDYVGLSVKTESNQEVRVRLQPNDSETSVWLVEVDL